MSAFFKAKNNKGIDSLSDGDEESSSSSSLSVSQISIEDNNLESI